MKKFFIYLQSEDKVSWILQDEKQQLLKSSFHDSFDTLPKDIETAKIYVIVPGEDVLLTSVTLPKMSRPRLRQALPFALEEKLLADVTELHFALPTKIPSEDVPVAVVKKQKMTHWLMTLKHHQIHPHFLAPMIFFLPNEPWSILLEENICTARTGKYSGFACEPNNLVAFLTAAQEKPSQFKLYNFSQTFDTKSIEQFITEEIKSDQHILELIGAWHTVDGPINLLQTYFHTKPQKSLFKNPWRLSGILTIFLISLFFLGAIASYFILQQASQASEKQIATIYKKHFPAATAIVAPRERMESKLKQGSGQQKNTLLLYMLSILGDGLTQVPQLKLENFDFRNHQLTATVMADSFDNLDQFIQWLNRQGLHVKQENATTINSKVKASLLITQGNV